jgi:hypothetical protein
MANNGCLRKLNITCEILGSYGVEHEDERAV